MAETSTTGNPSGGAAGDGGGLGSGGGGAAAAAPAASAPASTPTNSESALSSVEKASAALESASSADKPVNQPPVSGKSGETALAGQVDGKGGQTFHIPTNKAEYDRILENARTKAIEEYKGKFGWAEGYDGDAVKEGMQLLIEMHQDPMAFAKSILAENQGEEELVDPEPDYHAPDGSAQFYSDKTMKTILQNFEKKLLRQMQPALTAAERQAQQERVAAITSEAKAVADEALAEIRKYPNFEEYKGEIHKKMQAMDPKTRRRVGSVAALHMAYQAVMNENGEKIRSGVEESVRTEFAKKAAAGIGHVQPGNQANVRPALKDGDVDGLAKRMEEIHAGMSQ